MPPRRRYTRKPNRRRRYGRARMANTGKFVTKRQLLRVTALDRSNYREIGTVDTGNIAAYDSATVNNVISFIAPPGVISQRLIWKKITARMRFRNLASAGAVMVRTIIFQWHTSSDIAPTSGAILATTPTQWDFLAPINYSAPSGNRFTVLKDFTVRLGELAATDGTDMVYKKFVIPGKRLRRLLYSDTSASLDGRNNIYIILTSPVASTADPPLVDYWFSGESVLETYSNP